MVMPMPMTTPTSMSADGDGDIDGDGSCDGDVDADGIVIFLVGSTLEFSVITSYVEACEGAIDERELLFCHVLLYVHELLHWWACPCLGYQ